MSKVPAFEALSSLKSMLKKVLRKCFPNRKNGLQITLTIFQQPAEYGSPMRVSIYGFRPGISLRRLQPCIPSPRR